MLPSDLERRATAGVTARGRHLIGTVARFNSEARIGTFVERIAPGAFARSLASGADILALADHDPRAVLGRTKSGTLKLREDSAGLQFELAIPDTQHGRDLLALAERGDLGGMSFGFRVPQGGDVWDGDKRTLRDVDLAEVSVVQSWPAYGETTVAVRGRGDERLAVMRYWLETCR